MEPIFIPPTKDVWIPPSKGKRKVTEKVDVNIHVNSEKVGSHDGSHDVFGSMMSSIVSVSKVTKKKKRKVNDKEKNKNFSLEYPKVRSVIKVYGERNTGTNFLQTLLLQNTFSPLLSPHYLSGWKHGFPSSSHVQKRDRDSCVYVFCVREVAEWVGSCWRNCYHMKRRGDVEEFVG